jgi:RP/EB family microtubule-associated protein
VDELRASVESLEKERDFYFGKLRDIEILMQTYTGTDQQMVDTILKIMYATEEDFVSVDEAGNPVVPT